MAIEHRDTLPGHSHCEGADGVVAESKVGAEVQAWSPGARVPSRLSESKEVSVHLVWPFLGIVSGWVYPEQERRVLESLD